MAKKNAAGAAEKEEAKLRAAQEASGRRAKGKKGKGMMPYYIVIGAFVAVTLFGVLLSMTGGSSRKSGSTSGSVNDIYFANENFTTASTPFFNRWTMDDVKYGLDGVALQGKDFVGMAGAIQRCEDEDGMEGGVLPAKYDVREASPSCAGAVYDSGNCSSSYAVAAAASLSSRFCIADPAKYGGLQLSPQQILSCDKKSQGCDGGAADSVWGYIQRRGLYPERCVPFAGAKKAACKTDCQESEKLKALSHCVKGGEKEIRREIYNRGPVVAPIYVKDDFLVYKSGVYSPTPDSTQQFGANGEALIQAVAVLGWGKSDGIRYWLVRNSWGAEWGEEGYARVAVDTVLHEGYALVGFPLTEEAAKAEAQRKEQEAQRREEAKRERAERDERIREKQRQRAEEQAAAQEAAEEDDDLDLDEPEEEVEM